MKLLMISGDRSVASGKRGPFALSQILPLPVYWVPLSDEGDR